MKKFYCIILIYFFFTSLVSQAQVSILGVTSTLGICTDDGVGKLIPPIIIQENQTNNISGSTHNNFQLALPTCFQFNAKVQPKLNTDIGDFNGGYVALSKDKATVHFDKIIPENNPIGGDTKFGFPVGNWIGFQRTSMLYLASELNLNNKVLNGVSFYVTDVTNPPRNYIRIFAKPTGVTALTSTTLAVEKQGFILLYQGWVDPSIYKKDSWVHFPFTQDFYTGTTNNNLQLFIEADLGGSGTYFFNGFRYMGMDRLKFRSYATANSRTQLWYDNGAVNVNSNCELLNSGVATAFSYYINNSNLDNITISGLQAIANEANKSGDITGTSISGISGLNISTKLGTLSSVAAGSIILTQDNYCQNSPTETFNYFPSGGIFSASTVLSGLSSVNVQSSNQATFNTAVYDKDKYTKVAIRYSYPTINGCSLIQKDVLIKPIPENSNFSPFVDHFNFNQPNGSNPSFSYLDNNAITLAAYINDSDGGIITFSAPSGVGGSVNSGFKFYPKFAVYPNLPAAIPVSCLYLNTVTGCSNTIIKPFTIFNPTDIFIFNPLLPTGPKRFCIDDAQLYKMDLNTSTGTTMPNVFFPSTFNSVFDTRISSITASNVPTNTTVLGVDGWGYGITTVGTGFGNHRNFRFSPALINATIPSVGLSIDLSFNYDLLVETIFSTTTNGIVTTTLGMQRSQPTNYGSVIGKGATQSVIVYNKPAPPLLKFGNKAYCRGAVTDTVLEIQNESNATYEFTRVQAGLESIQLSSSSSIISLSGLGFNNNSSVGGYDFRIRQILDGCKSDFVSFTVKIKEIPTAPGVSSMITSLPIFCADSIYTAELKPDYTISGTNVVYNWYKNALPSIVGQNIISKQTSLIESNITTTTSYFVTVDLDGCSSNLLLTTLTGPNPTISQILLFFNPRPLPPTVGSSSIFCVGDVVMPISISGMASSPIKFRWFQNPIATLPANDYTGTTTGNVGSGFSNFFTPNFSTSITSNIIYYAKTIYVATGCKSLQATPVEFNVNINQEIPGIQSTSGETFNNRPFCYNQSNSNPITVSGSSIFANPIYLWQYNSTTSSIISSTIPSLPTSTINGAVPGEETIYLRTLANSCRSAFTKVIVKVDPPVPPLIVTNAFQFYCTNDQLSDFIGLSTLSGATINWFTASNNIIPTATGLKFNPQTLGVFNTTVDSPINIFYANITNSLGCVSTLTSFNIEVRKTPSVPSFFDIVSCAGIYGLSPLRSFTPYLGVPNQYIEWYYPDLTLTGIASTVGGTVLENRLPLSFLGSNFMQETIIGINLTHHANGCKSSTGNANIFIKSVPIVPTIAAFDKNICSGEPLVTITATSIYNTPIYNWYTASILSLPVSNAKTLATASYISNATVSWVSTTKLPDTYIFYLSQNTNYGIFGNNTFSGCTSLATRDTVKIYPNPPPPFVNSLPNYCAGDVIAPISISGVTSTVGINWFASSILGVSVSSQNPYNTNIPNTATGTSSQYSLYVTQTFNDCRSDFSTVNILINPLPIVDMTIAGLNFCNNEGIKTIKAIPVGGTYIATVPGFLSLGGGYASINTATPPQNTYPIRYNYTDANNCKNFVSKNIGIFSKPIIDLSFPTTALGFCASFKNNIPIFPVFFEPGQVLLDVFRVVDNSSLSSTTPIINNVFIPSNTLLPGLKSDSIQFRYIHIVNNTPCRDTVYKKKYIYASPIVNFDIPLDKCENKLYDFIGKVSISGGNLQDLAYTWKFGSNDITTGGLNLINIKKSFKIGNVSANLKIETPFGCASEISKQFQIGPYPITAFDWKNICYGSSTQFRDLTTLSSGFISDRTWNFDTRFLIEDTSTIAFVTKKFPTVGIYNVKLKVTSEKGCAKDTTMEVNILPNRAITPSTPYSSGFEVDQQGWFSEGKSNSWAYGTPSSRYKSFSKTPAKIWRTSTVGDSIYSNGQISYVNSPCFDMSALNRPIVSLMIKTASRDGIDGAVLQASDDNGMLWNTIGLVQSKIGLNWYNSDNILAVPGKNEATTNVPEGWSGIFNTTATGGWVLAKNVFDDARITNLSNVRFRIAFSSANAPITENNNYEGFAFDDIWIGDKTKFAVIEQFSNTSDNNASRNANEAAYVNFDTDKVPATSKGLECLVNNNTKDVVAIDYHTSFPESDPFNEVNSTDPSARVLYYGVQKTPYTVFDGNVFNGLSLSNDSLRLNGRTIFNRSLEIPKFSIGITKYITNGVLNITTTITSNEIISDTVVLHVAVVERKVIDKTNKSLQQSFENVLRIMLPNAGGTSLMQTWNAGTTKTITNDWEIKNITNIDQIGVVAFIQHTKTKEILQGGYTGPIIIVCAQDTIKPIFNPTNIAEEKNLSNIEIYPNPASSMVTIKCNVTNDTPIKLVLIDQYGKTQIAKNLDLNQEHVIDIDILPSGIYLMQILDSQKVLINKKIVVIH